MYTAVMVFSLFLLVVAALADWFMARRKLILGARMLILFASSLLIGMVFYNWSLPLQGTPEAPGEAVQAAFGPVKDLFFTLLKMIIAPLLLACMVTAVCSVGDVRKLGRLGGRTALYYLTTTSISVLIGIVLVNAVSPGTRYLAGGGHQHVLVSRAIQAYMDANPDDPFQGEVGVQDFEARFNAWWADAHGDEITTLKAELTEYDTNDLQRVLDPIRRYRGKIEGKQKTPLQVILSIVPQNPVKSMAEGKYLQVIFFGLVLGAAISTLGDRGKTIVAFFNQFMSAMMQLTLWIVQLAPVAVFSLVLYMVARSGFRELSTIPAYVFTVLTGLSIHAFVILPLIVFMIARRSPWAFLKNMFTATTMAFSTASSAATLPITLRCLIDRAKVSQRITNFVAQIGCTINMDGTALYESVAAIFIAQVYGIHLGIGEMFTVFITATLASVGAAAVPEAGLITMAIVLNAVGIPLEGVGIILVVDSFLDRFRTAVNVWGDSCGCAVIDKLEGSAEAVSEAA